jgi:hypothetical protein
MVVLWVCCLQLRLLVAKLQVKSSQDTARHDPSSSGPLSGGVEV